VSGWIDEDACPLSLASRGRDLNAAMVPVPGRAARRPPERYGFLVLAGTALGPPLAHG